MKFHFPHTPLGSKSEIKTLKYKTQNCEKSFSGKCENDYLLLQMIQLLLEKGATINAFDKKDRRALHWAAFMGHVDVVKTLANFGAELNCRDKTVTNTPLLSPCPLCYHTVNPPRKVLPPPPHSTDPSPVNMAFPTIWWEVRWA